MRIRLFSSRSSISSGVFTSRASVVTGAESISRIPSRWSARNPGVPRRSTASGALASTPRAGGAGAHRRADGRSAWDSLQLPRGHVLPVAFAHQLIVLVDLEAEVEEVGR